jgi:transcriptional regulator with XRE-family HTH domain
MEAFIYRKINVSTFAERIREARRSAGLTQLDLAQACGLTRGAVALWESSGHAGTQPRTELLREIAKALGVPLDWLMDDSAEPESVWYFPNRRTEGGKLLSQIAREEESRTGYQVSYVSGSIRGDPAERAERGRTRPSRGIVDLLPDVLPDVEQDGHLFCFANTPQQIANKIDALSRAPAELHKHLVLIGCESTVHCAKDPGEALARVVEILKKA